MLHKDFAANTFIPQTHLAYAAAIRSSQGCQRSDCKTIPAPRPTGFAAHAVPAHLALLAARAPSPVQFGIAPNPHKPTTSDSFRVHDVRADRRLSRHSRRRGWVREPEGLVEAP